MDNPVWIPSARSASIRKWAEQLHDQARSVFLKDGTHVHILFCFSGEKGLVSVNAVPPKTDHAQVYNAIRGAIKDHDLYAVIQIGECWTYFAKEHDHTAFQLLDGEMRVSDLKDGDKTEALQVRMESSDGDCVIYLDRIVRKEGKTGLEDCRVITNEDQKWFGVE